MQARNLPNGVSLPDSEPQKTPEKVSISIIGENCMNEEANGLCFSSMSSPSHLLVHSASTLGDVTPLSVATNFTPMTEQAHQNIPQEKTHSSSEVSAYTMENVAICADQEIPSQDADDAIDDASHKVTLFAVPANAPNEAPSTGSLPKHFEDNTPRSVIADASPRMPHILHVIPDIVPTRKDIPDNIPASAEITTHYTDLQEVPDNSPVEDPVNSPEPLVTSDTVPESADVSDSSSEAVSSLPLVSPADAQHYATNLLSNHPHAGALLFDTSMTIDQHDTGLPWYVTSETIGTAIEDILPSASRHDALASTMRALVDVLVHLQSLRLYHNAVSTTTIRILADGRVVLVNFDASICFHDQHRYCSMKVMSPYGNDYWHGVSADFTQNENEVKDALVESIGEVYLQLLLGIGVRTREVKFLIALPDTTAETLQQLLHDRYKCDVSIAECSALISMLVPCAAIATDDIRWSLHQVAQFIAEQYPL